MQTVDAILTCALVISGCATEQVQVQHISTDTAWIQAGVTTRDEIMKRLGNPESTVSLPDGEIAVYRGAQASVPSPVPGIPTLVPTVLGATPMVTPPSSTTSELTRQNQSGQLFWVHYDARGVVQELRFGDAFSPGRPSPE
ncbi:MAG: hypothetical protein ACT4OO_02665 [Nitrospiraceae bacterium]